MTCDDGSLRWQNGLTPRNWGFFGAADGIFTNYCWKGPDSLLASVRLAEKGPLEEEEEEQEDTLRRRRRRHAAEVWVGTDAFGRGSYGGTGTAGVAAAAAAAASVGASLAVFAPGWVIEAFEGDDGDFSGASGGGCSSSSNNAWRARADEFWRGVDSAYRERRRPRGRGRRGAA